MSNQGLSVLPLPRGTLKGKLKCLQFWTPVPYRPNLLVCIWRCCVSLSVNFLQSLKSLKTSKDLPTVCTFFVSFQFYELAIWQTLNSLALITLQICSLRALLAPLFYSFLQDTVLWLLGHPRTSLILQGVVTGPWILGRTTPLSENGWEKVRAEEVQMPEIWRLVGALQLGGSCCLHPPHPLPPSDKAFVSQSPFKGTTELTTLLPSIRCAGGVHRASCQGCGHPSEFCSGCHPGLFSQLWPALAMVLSQWYFCGVQGLFQERLWLRCFLLTRSPDKIFWQK